MRSRFDEQLEKFIRDHPDTRLIIFALLLTKVTKPAAERRKVFQSNNRKIGGDTYKTNNQRNVR